MSPSLLVVALLHSSRALPTAAASDSVSGTSQWVELERPARADDHVALELSLDGEPCVIELERHSLRSEDCAARAWVEPGLYTPVALAPPRTYRGEIVGRHPGKFVGALTHAGWSGVAILDDGRNFTLEPLSTSEAGRGVHLRWRAGIESLEDFECGLEPLAPPPAPLVTGPASVAHLRPYAETCTKVCQIAFDADQWYYAQQGSSVSAVIDRIDQHMNLVDFFYARDVRIQYSITHYIVRTTDFYPMPTSGGGHLDFFRNEWNTNQASIVRDIAHLMTNAPNIQYGGLAWVDVVCTSSGYGWSLDSAGIVGHEVGHNWGAPHCLDTSPCNNMCGACLFIGPVTRAVIAQRRDTRPCLDVAGPYAQRLPPYATPDSASLTKDRYDTIGAIMLDVLANDDDGNCDAVRLPAQSLVGTRGGTATVAPGAGPGGRDVLVYTLPAQAFVGEDVLTYTVADDYGRSTAGRASVVVEPAQVLGWWPLDELSGSTASDLSGRGLAGTASGSPSWVAGHDGGGLFFDGTDDHVSIPALGAASDRLTITCWLKRFGAQSSWAGIAFSRAGSTIAGLHFGPSNDLRYTWDNQAATYNFASGLVPPNDAWALCALVVEPTRATLYLHDGVQLSSAVNHLPHAPEAFDGELRLGHDPSSSTRRLRGTLDDVRVHKRALSAAEIGDLALRGGRAQVPAPLDGGELHERDGRLSWQPAWPATSHGVYVGTNYAAVRDAGTASSEYQGSFATPQFTLSSAPVETEIYWRVDEESPGGSVRGDVWQLSVPRMHRWRLDEQSGAQCSDSENGNHGTYLNGVLLDQPGAQPFTGTSASFDGSNDRIDIPALNLATDRWTVSMWVQRNGAQSPWAGLAFSRTSQTVAGLNFGTAHELRYHWDAGNWGWDSGLVVPDGQWVFVALVVEPTRARVYLGQNGSLTSATNATGHALEPFEGVFTIGRDPAGGRQFRGLLDDVRVFRSALSDADVARLFAGTF